MKKENKTKQYKEFKRKAEKWAIKKKPKFEKITLEEILKDKK